MKYRLIPLKGKKRFANIFANAKKMATKKLFLAVHFQNIEQDSIIEYAVVVGKKTSKSAVMRNRIKRLLRESLKKEIADYLQKDVNYPIRFIILNWKIAPENPRQICLEEVRQELNFLLTKAKKYFKN